MKTSKAKIKRYEFKEQIGKGNFAQVWKAIDNTTYNFCAIKILDNEQIKAQPKVLELLQSEINILKIIDHPNVVKLYDSFEEKGKYYLIMEYCNGGDLEHYVRAKQDRCVSESEALGFFKQLLNGFKALHEIKAMHRDFKLANVLMHDGVLKIADLGFSKQADLARTALGTGVYMAPEIMKYQKYTNKVDIWSLGICLYEMLFGKCPFFGRNEIELLSDVERNNLNFNAKGQNLSENFQNLIKKMLIVDPAKRIDWIEIYNSPLLNNDGVKGTATVFLSRGDVEIQHQNVLFQNNKVFYGDKKNLEYDNEEIIKTGKGMKQQSPIKSEEHSDESVDKKSESTLKIKNYQSNKQAIIKKILEKKEKQVEKIEKKTEKNEKKVEQNEKKSAKNEKKQGNSSNSEEETTMKLKPQLQKNKNKRKSDVSSDSSDHNATIKNKPKAMNQKLTSDSDEEVDDPKNKEITKPMPQKKRESSNDETKEVKHYKKKESKKSPMKEKSDSEDETKEITFQRKVYGKAQAKSPMNKKEEKTMETHKYKKKEKEEEKEETTMARPVYKKKEAKDEKKQSKKAEKKSSDDEETRDIRLLNKNEEFKRSDEKKKSHKLPEKKLPSSDEEDHEPTMDLRILAAKKEQEKQSKQGTMKKNEDKEKEKEKDPMKKVSEKQNNSSDEEMTLKAKMPKSKKKEQEEISKSVKDNLAKVLTQKSEALTLLESKYLHTRNIISHHAKILYDGAKLSSNGNAIYTYFILARRLMRLSKDFWQVLEEKENSFKEGKFFKDFVSSRAYEKISDVFKEQKEIYENYYNYILETIKDYPTYENGLYEKLKSEFNEDNNNLACSQDLKKIDLLFKQVLVDYCFTASATIEAWKEEKNIDKDKAREYAIHMIELVDCCLYNEMFTFNEKEEAGFNFIVYEEKLKEMELGGLIDKLGKKIEVLVSAAFK